MTNPGSSPIEIWYCDMDAIDVDEAELDSYLTGGERLRASRFAFENLRRRYRIGRAALRRVLAAVRGQRPSEVPIARLAHGKPYVADGPEFNMSASDSMLLIGIGRELSLGVDVEFVRNIGNVADLAGRYFSARERADIEVLSPPENLRSFFRIWTRKEAVIKALGLGLNMDLSTFSVPADAADACVEVATTAGFPGDRVWFVRPVELFPSAEWAIAADVPFRVDGRHEIQHGLQWAGGS